MFSLLNYLLKSESIGGMEVVIFLMIHMQNFTVQVKQKM